MTHHSRLRYAVLSDLRVPERSEKSLAAAGIEIFHERARFVDRNVVRVGETVLESQYVRIRSGACVRVRSGMIAHDLKKVIFAYPTRASDVPYMM
jgi:pyruvate/2-oxoglutarate dehydrogenase complex dihydrolipoamide dehydrogenase (E3) component